MAVYGYFNINFLAQQSSSTTLTENTLISLEFTRKKDNKTVKIHYFSPVLQFHPILILPLFGISVKKELIENKVHTKREELGDVTYKT